MTKKEMIWREILFETRVNKKIKFTQKELAKKFGFSLSTVFNALKLPRDSHAIEVTGRFFTLNDYRKLLFLWASERNIKNDIYYKTYVSESAQNLEGIMPPNVIFGFYSGFKFHFKKTPADYDHLYIYAEKKVLPLILRRIETKIQPRGGNAPNFFILEPDDYFYTYKQPLLEQIFVDIWNSPEWYAKDFLRELEKEFYEK